ncbi:MAG: sigma-70 family RNA polymerase sigma factor [Planctomycetes bacterium]|nr:sigma-70 family RNA polymerase sigma factor [Planctomycetota bacterium]MCB9870182.1 sigma-70 family RNA polymerase sigma factor [Planctomycetota bacterium]MCB9888238.1 sigma-70 family RNA polymerase sigma factor [Planctomycetota bacterium]
MADPAARELATRILCSREADEGALMRLAPLVYDELRELAARQLRNERSDCSLDTTALVHEAYLRLVDSPAVTARGKSYFFAASARAMRQVLVDRARARDAARRGGGADRVTLVPELATTLGIDFDVLALEECLVELARLDPRQAEVVQMRFFAGAGIAEIAAALDVSERTVKSDWQMARAWLRVRMQDDGAQTP